LLLLLPSAAAELRLRMWNPDGSEAEACGNGLRCFVRYARDRGLARSDDVAVETMAGTRAAQVMNGTDIRVAMGKPGFAPAAIPAAIEGREPADDTPVLEYPLDVDGTRLTVGCVSMGNPHAVCFLNEPVGEFPLGKVGPMVEHHRMFPNRANFEVANVVNRGDITARVWERGAGETLACGSGACAIAVIAKVRGLADSPVTIHLPGGDLTVEWDGAGEVNLIGPAEQVFTGTWGLGPS
jgi:diaminopimelate epimerase